MHVLHSGTVVGDVDLVNNTNEANGDCTVADGTTWRWLIAGATEQAQINPFLVTGGRTFNHNGRFEANGAYQLMIRMQSNDANPNSNAYTGHVFNGVDAGSSISYFEIRNASTAFNFSSSYTADNLTLNKVKIVNCGRGVQIATTTVIVKGALEFTEATHTNLSNGINFGAAGNATFETCFVHDFGGSFLNLTQGVLILNTLVHRNSSGSIATRASGTPSLTIGQLYAFGNTSALFSGWTSGTLDVNGGVVDDCYAGVLSNCLNVNVTMDDVDCYLKHQTFSGTGGGNLNHCLVSGGRDQASASMSYDPNRIATNSGGTPNGAQELNTEVYVNMDSVTNPITSFASANRPKTITAVSVDTPVNGGFTVHYTANHPGESGVVFSETPIAVDHPDDLDQYPIRSALEHGEAIDYSGANKLFFQASARARAQTGLKPGKPYYARPYLRPSGSSNRDDLLWGAEVSGTTGGSSGTGEIIPPTLVKVENNGTGTQVVVTITPPNVSAEIYDHVQVLYKLRSATAWTEGVTYVGAPGVEGAVTQTGLVNHQLYEFMLYAVSDAVEGQTSKSKPTATARIYTDDGSHESRENLVLDNLETLLAHCPTLHEWFQLSGSFDANVTAARVLIRRHQHPDDIELPDDDDDPGPVRCLITIEDDFSHATLGAGAGFAFGISGSGYVFFRQFVAVDDQDDPKQAYADFMEKAGVLLEEIKSLSGSDDFLCVEDIRYLYGPQRSAKPDKLDCYEIAYKFGFSGI